MAFTGILITLARPSSGLPTLPRELVWTEHHTVAGPCTSQVPDDQVASNPPEYILEVYSATDAFIAYGASPDAVNGPRYFVKAGLHQDFAVCPGDHIAWYPIP